MTAKDLKTLLKSGNTDLSTIVSRAGAMQTLRSTAIADLPAADRDHVTDVTVDEHNRLIVIADSAAWAARLRFLSDTLLSAARKHGVPAISCQVKVRPLRQTPEQDTKPAQY